MGGDGSAKILYTFTDRSCSTGDYLIKTEDGRVWKASLGGSPMSGTGVVTGTLHDGKIYPR